MQAQSPSQHEAGEIRRARRRLRFVGPNNAVKILRHDRYWTSAFWSLYLEQCRLLRLSEPEAARALAGHGPDLVARIARLGFDPERPELFRSAAEFRSAEVRSWSLLADCELLSENKKTENARRALCKARAAAAAEKRPDGGRISLAAFSELRRASALFDLALGRREEALRQIEELARDSRHAVDGVSQIPDDVARQYAETLLLLGSAPMWSAPTRAEGPSGLTPESDGGQRGPAILAQCAAFARPRTPLGESIFDTALDLLDRRLNGHRPIPSTLESAGRWLRRARRQPFKRGDRFRRMRLVWSEGRVLSSLGISRLAERRLLRARESLGLAHDPLRLALVTLDLVLLDIGRDDREAAAARLQEARERLSPIEDPELAELLHQARRAPYDSLLIFRRRLGRRLEKDPPVALVPRPPAPRATTWSTPSLGGAG